MLPPPIFRRDVARTKDPYLQDIVRLSHRYKVSKGATGRAYVTFRDEPMALVITHEGKVLRSYKNTQCPFLAAPRGKPVPALSMLKRRRLDMGVASETEACEYAAWFDTERGKRPPALSEQVLPQREGFAMILLHVHVEADEDEDDQEDGMTSRERYRSRAGR